jgi:hypothetical protein
MTKSSGLSELKNFLFSKPQVKLDRINPPSIPAAPRQAIGIAHPPPIEAGFGRTNDPYDKLDPTRSILYRETVDAQST